MSQEKMEDLKQALQEAEISDVDLEGVAGGNCNESCEQGCSACCSPGSANRGGSGGGDIEYQTAP